MHHSLPFFSSTVDGENSLDLYGATLETKDLTNLSIHHSAEDVSANRALLQMMFDRYQKMELGLKRKVNVYQASNYTLLSRECEKNPLHADPQSRLVCPFLGYAS